MLNLLKALRQDEYGVILSAEIVIVGTVLVIGVMTGMACLQKSVNGELGDLARAIGSMDQSYSFSGHRKAGGLNGWGNCCAFTAGSSFVNNECNANACQHDMIGCEGQVMLQSGSRGTCGSCGAAFNASGACSACGMSGYGSFNQPDSVSTGVPNMKVTEYPGTSIVPRTSNEGKSPIRFPELERQTPAHQFVPPEPHRPIPLPQPRVPGSTESDGQLRPIPQNEPLPATPPSPPQPQL